MASCGGGGVASGGVEKMVDWLAGGLVGGRTCWVPDL